MTAFAPDLILAVFLIFCRVGGCLLIVPGFSSSTVPPQVRLFIAFSIALALTPLLLAPVRAAMPDQQPYTLLRLIASESLTGFLIGFLGRLFFMALQTMATALAMAISLGGMPGVSVGDHEPLPTLVTLISVAATALIFVADLHWELLRGLVASYTRLPPGQSFDFSFGLTLIVDQLTAAFLLALRISSPFIVYSIIVNLAVGLVNKLTPQIPAFFIFMPFVAAGGLLMVYFLMSEFLTLFMSGFSSWLLQGR